MGNRLHNVKQILEADIYEIVDLKVKIITKSQSKQSVMKNPVSMQKIDTIVADDTGTTKLVIILWEELIGSVHTGLPYHFSNLTIHIFDDEKFVSSNVDNSCTNRWHYTPYGKSRNKRQVSSRTMDCH